MPCRCHCRPASQRGSILSESALVLFILALISLAVYLSLDTMQKRADMTRAIEEVQAIRLAVTQWDTQAPADQDPSALHWSLLVSFLPESLQEAARHTEGLALKGMTPWTGDYVLVHSADDPHGRLAIAGVPEDMREALASQLQNSAATTLGPCPAPVPVGDLCTRLRVPQTATP